MYRYFFVLHSIVLNNLNKKKNCWSSYQHWPCSAILIHGGWSWSSRQGNICHRYSCFPIHQLYQSLHLQKYILFLLEKDILSHWEWIFFSQEECVVNQVDSFVWENIPVFIVLLYFVNIQAFISLFLGSCFWSRIIIVYTCTTGTCIKFTKSKKSLECPVKTWTKIPTWISKSFLPYVSSKPVFSISKACPIP